MEQNIAVRNKTLNLIIYALMTALVFVATRIIQIPSAFSEGGMMHLGNIAMFTIALIFGRKKGAVAGGLGMMISDLTSPWAAWALPTFIIRFIMGWITGMIAHRNGAEGRSLKLNVIGILASLPVLIGGYYIAEAIMTGNWIAPYLGIPGNMVQFVIGLVGSIFLTGALVHIPTVKNLQKDTRD